MSNEVLHEEIEDYSEGIVQYNINGDDITVYFQEKPEIIKNIIEDDEFAFIYIKKAQEEGKLADKNLSPNTPIVKFSRCIVDKEISEAAEDSLSQIEPLKPYEKHSKPEDLIVWGHKFKATKNDIKATYDLLEIRSRDDIVALFDDPSVKQIQIWEQIAKMLCDLGYNLGHQGAERCRQKFINLRKSYYNYKKSLEQGNENNLRKPLFIDEMEKLCKDKEYIQKKITFREKLENFKKKLKNNTDSVNNDDDDDDDDQDKPRIYTEISRNNSVENDVLNDHNYLFIVKDEEKIMSDVENDYVSDNASLEENSSKEIIKTMKNLHEKQMIFQQNLHQQLINTIKENTEQTKKLNSFLEIFVRKRFTKTRKRKRGDE